MGKGVRHLLHSNHRLHQPIYLSNYLILVLTIIDLEYVRNTNLRNRATQYPLGNQDLIEHLDLSDGAKSLDHTPITVIGG